jgi:hypothetical protein
MSNREFCVNKIIALSMLLTTIACMGPAPAQAQATTGHENGCVVTNVGYDVGQMHVICASGSINYAFLTGAGQLGNATATCPAVDSDTLKMFDSIALAARVTGLVVTVWYTHNCVPGTLDIHAITGLEMQGN